VLNECYDPARHKPGGAHRLARTRHFDDLDDPATRRDLNAASSSRSDDLVGPRTVVCGNNDLDTIALHGRERTSSFEADPVLRLAGAPPCDARSAVAPSEQRLMLGSGVAGRLRRQCGRCGSLALLPRAIAAVRVVRLLVALSLIVHWGSLGEQAAANRSAVRWSAAYWIAMRRAVAMLVVLMSAGVGAWQVVDGNTTLGAMCIFVGGGAFFVTVAWLRHGREGGENGFVEFVIGFLTQGP
jgi:hypothetical protein